MGGIFDVISPLLTTVSEGVAANQEGKRKGSELLRAIMGQNAALEEKRAGTQKATAEALLADQRRNALGDPTKVINSPDGPSVVHTATGTATPVTQDGKRILAPVKAPPRIDPLSPEGIAARKQILPPTKPRNIDPLSPEGIAARLQLKPPAVGGAKSLPAPLSARVSQAGEMIKKAADLFPMIDGLGATVGNSAAADLAEHGIGIAGHALPGSKGIGNMMLNNDANYSQYNSALEPFVLAAAHAIGGARITEVQRDAIRRSVRIEPGDIRNPKVMAQKKKNMLDLVNSTVGGLPADAMSAQEDQMEPSLLAALKGHGYKGATRIQPQQGTAPAGNVSLAEQHPKPPGAVTLGGGKPTLQERVQQLKAQGVPREQAKATLIQEGLLPPGGDE